MSPSSCSIGNDLLNDGLLGIMDGYLSSTGDFFLDRDAYNSSFAKRHEEILSWSQLQVGRSKWHY